jgi:hypothetical protein
VREALVLDFQFAQALGIRVGLVQFGQRMAQEVGKIAAISVVAAQIVDLAVTWRQ